MSVETKIPKLPQRKARLAPDKADHVVLKDETGQAPGGVSTGVDIDAVRPHLGFKYRRMSMDDDFLERLLMQKKILPDPEKIRVALRIERNMRTHTGVDKEKIPERQGDMQVLKKSQMRLRHCALQGRRDLRAFVSAWLHRWTQTVGHQSRQGAEAAPVSQNPGGG